MIIKGGARTGRASYTKYLAWHLMRLDQNEQCTVRELFGVVSADLRGALEELAAYGAGAISKRPLYAVSINSDPTQPPLTEDQKDFAVAAVGYAMGLEAQPRAVVEHVKNGRTHLHVVWSRIDLDRMTAIHDGKNFRRHEQVARGLEVAFGHEHVPGAFTGRDGTPRPARTPTMAEQRQAERSGVTAETMSEFMTDVWQLTDTGHSFHEALLEMGAVLARGDRRPIVIVDPVGEVHSLSRRIKGVRAAEVNARMANLDLATLPTVVEAKAAQRMRWAELSVMEEVHGIPVWAKRQEMDGPPWDPSAAPVAPPRPVAVEPPIVTPLSGDGHEPEAEAPTTGPHRAPATPAIPIDVIRSTKLGIGPAPSSTRGATSAKRRRTPPDVDPSVILRPGTSIPLGFGKEPPPKAPSKLPVAMPPGWSQELSIGKPSSSGEVRGRGRGRGKRGPQR